MTLPRYLKIDDRLKVPLSEVDFSFARSSGPGGQNVNKVNTKAVLTWSVATSNCLPSSVRDRFLVTYQNRISAEGSITIRSERFRNQQRNIEDCLAKLRSMIQSVAKPPKKRLKTKPPVGSVQNRLTGKKRKSLKKLRRRTPTEDE